jgi:sepiapterin reductase
MALFQQDAVCVITGASRGLGRSVAKAFAAEWSQGGAKVMFVLIARTVRDLEETRDIIVQKFQSAKVESNVKVRVLTCDLGDFSALEKATSEIKSILGQCSAMKRAILVHNAGSLGDVSKHCHHITAREVSAYFDFNFASFVHLTSAFMSSSFESKLIIDITSIISKIPLEGTALYGAGKGAREYYLKVLAKESPSVRILSYGPGPCDTDMHRSLRNDWVSQDNKKNAQEAYRKGEILDPDTSIAKLVGILKEDQFENSVMVDFYDEPKGV